jgi:TolB protein
MNRLLTTLSLLTLLSLAANLSAQTNKLVVPVDVDPTKLIPMNLSGFSGEVAQVVRFDLEVAGFIQVPPDKAQYLISGSNSDHVEGRVTAGSNGPLIVNKAYSGGTERLQAHSLADEISQAILGKPGIARTRIAFRADADRGSEVYIADYDGHGATAMTHDGSIVGAPCWSPGNHVLYYTSYLMGDRPIIFEHNLSSGKRSAVAAYSGLNTSPAISFDGSRLAMILSKAGSPDVYVASANGSNPKQLTETPEDESSPCWSPDGRWICFATRIDGRRVLAKVPSGGGPSRVVATSGVSNPSEPDWSPDGTMIAFTAQMGSFHICTIPAEGGTASVLCEGEDPSWAPNSRTIVFTRRGADGQRGLSLLDAPTKHVKDIPQHAGAWSQPAWAR